MKLNIFLAIALSTICITGFNFDASAQESNFSNPSDKIQPLKDPTILRINKDDIVMGNPDAKVTIIEYSSLACPHCATLHSEALQMIKEKYIDTQKVNYVLRDFPTTTSALHAAKIAHCAGKDRYYDFIKTLFEWQSQWAFTREFVNPLEKIAKLGGISDKKLVECTTDQELEQFLLNRAMNANNSLKIGVTPVIYINGEKFEGAKPFSYFEKIIETKLKENR